jgi:hypothetical protein
LHRWNLYCIFIEWWLLVFMKFWFNSVCRSWFHWTVLMTECDNILGQEDKTCFASLMLWSDRLYHYIIDDWDRQIWCWVSIGSVRIAIGIPQ